MNENVFGNRLRILLEEKDIEGKEFAKFLHIQPPTLSNWLNGNRFPKDREILTNIANYFNVSLDYLLGKSNTRNPEESKGAKQEEFDPLALSEKDIITMAAHNVGHQGELSDEELQKVKLALKIALMKEDK